VSLDRRRRQSFLSIATVAWFPGNSWPKVQSALAPISDLRSFVCVGLLGLSTLIYVLPEGAEKKLEVSQFLFVPF